MTRLLPAAAALALLATPALADARWSHPSPLQFVRILVAECDRLHPGSPAGAKVCRDDEFHAQLVVSQQILVTGADAEAACAPGSGIALIPGSDPPHAMPSATAACMSKFMGVPIPPYTATPANLQAMIAAMIQSADALAAK